MGHALPSEMLEDIIQTQAWIVLGQLDFCPFYEKDTSWESCGSKNPADPRMRKDSYNRTGTDRQLKAQPSPDLQPREQK